MPHQVACFRTLSLDFAGQNVEDFAFGLYFRVTHFAHRFQHEIINSALVQSLVLVPLESIAVP